MATKHQEVDPYQDLVEETSRGKRLRIGLRILALLAGAWLIYFLLTGEHLFGIKTIGFLLFVFAGSLIEFRPRKSLRRRRMGNLEKELSAEDLMGIAKETLEKFDRGSEPIDELLLKLRSRFLELHHYMDDADIREKDRVYKGMQDGCLRKFLKYIVAGDFENAEKISFLSDLK